MVTFIDNLLLGAALSIPMGPANLLIIKNGLSKGFLESLKTATGGFCAELTYFTLVFLGISRFADLMITKIGLGSLGVLFLLKIGYDCLKDFLIPKKISEQSKAYKNPFIAGYLAMFLNPINFFMWAGIIGASFAQGGSFITATGVLLGIFIVLMSFVIVSGFGSKVINEKRMRFVSLISGLFIIFYGLRLLHNIFNFFR
jgi:threonine/homoserine/homoserine lactone efflux protein